MLLGGGRVFLDAGAREEQESAGARGGGEDGLHEIRHDAGVDCGEGEAANMAQEDKGNETGCGRNLCVCVCVCGCIGCL